MVTPQNMLLAALPRAAYLKLLPDLSPVTLSLGKILYEPHQSMRHVYFPEQCLVSLLTKVDGRLALEVGMVGREGMVGVPLALGIKMTSLRALVQGEGPALRMDKGRFLSALRNNPALQRGVHGYIHLLMGQIGQTAACNRFHELEARLARWLLMTRDRVGKGEFRLTQEFLSHMLGVRRVGVTKAASAFQRKKLIEYTRGKMRILDHRGLEAAACSCYRRACAEPGAIPSWRPAQSPPRNVPALHGVKAAVPRLGNVPRVVRPSSHLIQPAE